MKKIVFLFCILGLMGCNEVESGPDFGKACTQMASVDALVLNLYFVEPIENNLSVSFNGDEVDIDECDDNGFGVMRFNEDRTSVAIYYPLGFGSEDYLHYFQNIGEGGEPTDTSLFVKTSQRVSCDGPLTSISEVTKYPIVWVPVYANGEQCGITSYSASRRID